MQISESAKVKLEKKVMLVESEIFSDVTYAIDRKGRGMWLLVDGKEEVAIGDPVNFVKEMFEVWQHMKPEGAVS